jgi:hypothetical protein
MCPHDRKIGDNYGLSCADCGAQLEGLGFRGEGDGTCHHRFLSDGTDIDAAPTAALTLAQRGQDLLSECFQALAALRQLFLGHT